MTDAWRAWRLYRITLGCAWRALGTWGRDHSFRPPFGRVLALNQEKVRRSVDFKTVDLIGPARREAVLPVVKPFVRFNPV